MNTPLHYIFDKKLKTPEIFGKKTNFWSERAKTEKKYFR